MWFVLMGSFTAHEPVFLPKEEIDDDMGHSFSSKEEADAWVEEYREDANASYIPW